MAPLYSDRDFLTVGGEEKGKTDVFEDISKQAIEKFMDKQDFDKLKKA